MEDYVESGLAQIETLKILLTENHIPFETLQYKVPFSKVSLGTQSEQPFHKVALKIPSERAFKDSHGCSVIFGEYTYGFEEGLLEYWLRPCDAEPEGWATAEDILKRLKEHPEIWKDAEPDECTFCPVCNCKGQACTDAKE